MEQHRVTTDTPIDRALHPWRRGYLRAGATVSQRADSTFASQITMDHRTLRRLDDRRVGTGGLGVREPTLNEHRGEADQGVEEQIGSE